MDRRNKMGLWALVGLVCLLHTALAQHPSEAPVQYPTQPNNLTAGAGADTSSCFGRECGTAGARTIGTGRRRMAVFFIPVMFKLGIIMTLLVALTFMASQSLGIGVILLYFAFHNYNKWNWKHGHGHGHGHGWHRRSHLEELPLPVHVHYYEDEPEGPIFDVHPAHSYHIPPHALPAYKHRKWANNVNNIVEIVEPFRKVKEDYYMNKRQNSSRPMNPMMKSRRNR